jgi:hypothetical protein
MRYCSEDDYNSLEMNIPTLPVGNGCLREGADGSISVYRSDKSFSEIREENLRILQNKFDEIQSGTLSKHDKHLRYNCLIGYLLENIEKSNINFVSESSTLDEQKALLIKEKQFLNDQESVLRSNENSDLVAKYRTETSEKRNTELNTKFTIFVTMIIVFLIIEGIVFFV